MVRPLSLSLLALLLACGDKSGDDTAATGDDTATEATGDGGAGDGGAEDGGASETAEVHDMDVETLVTWLEERSAGTRDFLLINVHVPYAGDIPGTDADIAYTDTDGLVAAIGDQLDRTVVVYCRSGSMSAQASGDLVDLGYTAVYDLQGGMNAWQAAGYELDE